MNQLKLIIFVFAVFIFSFLLTFSHVLFAKKKSEKKVVLTTFTVLADMAKNVAGDKLQIESITRVGAEIHGYEPTPNDLIRAQKANLIIDNGLNLERWADKLYSNIPNVRHVTVSEGVIPISIADGPYKNKPNPHAWMSPSVAITYVKNIKDAFIELDPENKEVYMRNAQDYVSKLNQLDVRLRVEIDSLPKNRKYLVSCEGAFTYLIKDYGLRELYLWPINADSQGTPQQVRKVVNEVRKNKVPVVFCESTVNDKAQRQVSQETGAQFGGVFYVDSLSDTNGPASTYLQLLDSNLLTLIKGLNQ